MVVAMLGQLLIVAVGASTSIDYTQEREAVEALKKAGAKLTVLVKVEITNPSFNDNDLQGLVKHLAVLPDFYHLDLSNTAVTAAGLGVLKDLKQMRQLGVSDALQKSAAVKELQRLNQRLGVHGQMHKIGPLLPTKPQTK